MFNCRRRQLVRLREQRHLTNLIRNIAAQRRVADIIGDRIYSEIGVDLPFNDSANGIEETRAGYRIRMAIPLEIPSEIVSKLPTRYNGYTVIYERGRPMPEWII